MRPRRPFRAEGTLKSIHFEAALIGLLWLFAFANALWHLLQDVLG